MAEEKRTIKDRVSEEVKEGFSNTTQVLASNTREIMGNALGSLVDDIKGLASGAFGIVKGGISSIFGGKDKIEENNLDENKEQTGILQKMLGIFKRQEKRGLAEFDQGEGPSMFGIASAAIGGVIAGYVGTALSPFKAGGVVFNLFAKVIPSIFTWLKSRVLKIPELFKGTSLIEKITALNKEGSLLNSVITRIGSVLTSIRGVFSNIFTKIKSFNTSTGIISSITSKVNNIVSKTIGKLSALSEADGLLGTVFKFAKRLGSFVFYFRAAYDIVKELLSGKSIRDKILGISAGILGLVGELPELIINGILALFRSEFRVDFGKEKIISLVNTFTDWVFENITFPVISFISNIKEWFTSIINKLDPQNWLSNISFSPLNLHNLIPNFLSKTKDIFMNYILKLSPMYWFSNFVFDNTDIGNTIKNFILDTKDKFLNWIDKLNPVNWFSGINISIPNISGKLINWVTNIKNHFLSLIDKLNPINSLSNLNINAPNILGKLTGWLVNIKNKFISLVNKLNPFANEQDLTIQTPNIFNKLLGYWDSIVNWFSSKLELFNPANWLADDGGITLPDSIKNFFSIFNNLGNLIKDKIFSVIKPVLSKIPNWALPESVEKIKEQIINDNSITNNANTNVANDNTRNANTNQNNVINRNNEASNLQKINNTSNIENVRNTNNRSTQNITNLNIKETNNLLQKVHEMLKKMNDNVVKSGNKQEKVNNTMISQQNNSQQTNVNREIPEENQYLGLHLMNLNKG